MTNIEFPYETADDVYARYNVMLVLEELDNVGYAIDDIDGDGFYIDKTCFIKE